MWASLQVYACCQGSGGGGCCATVYREAKCGVGYKRLVDCGDLCSQGARFLFTKKSFSAVLRPVWYVAAAVQRVQAILQEDQQWSTSLQDKVRR